MKTFAPFLLIATALFLHANEGQAQSNRCADCHFANNAGYEFHLADWQMSAHARAGVGCESCHGGNASTFDRRLAHEGVRSSSNRRAPTHVLNISETCGSCHPGPFEAFQSSRHHEALEAGDRRAPTCTTCHSSVGNFLLSSRGLESQCQRCHGPKGKAPREGRPLASRDVHDHVNEIRAMLDAAERVLEQIEDADRKQEFAGELERAEQPLIRAVERFHTFVFVDAEELLEEAREAAADVLERISRPSG